jgi:hypothetical protein
MNAEVKPIVTGMPLSVTSIEVVPCRVEPLNGLRVMLHRLCMLRSNVIWAQGGDHLGGSLMDLSFALEILWKPATPRLD